MESALCVCARVCLCVCVCVVSVSVCVAMMMCVQVSTEFYREIYHVPFTLGIVCVVNQLQSSLNTTRN